ncbi:hypothetical protein ACIGEP_15525 [Microbacterium sp. NPDC077663]|uniref:hypothetical protein n=1 Tax=Microbacterium sp. NPDC077663 TaxID=3364189 RepID=UPI0037CBF566
MRIDALKSRELLATILAIKSLDKTVRKINRQQTKRIAAPEWRKALAQHADTRLEHRVIVDTAVVTVSDQNVRIQSASKGRPLSGGLNPKTDYHAIEFGVDQSKRTTYQRTRKGNRHRVTRRVGNALRARRWPTGYVFFPTARTFVPRMASLWVQTTVRTIANALEGKQE